MNEYSLVLGNRVVDDPEDRVRRYCGLPWSGGAPEVWAWPYYDAIQTDPDRIGPVDVLSCAALHPGLSKSDLSFFLEERRELEGFVTVLPGNVDLSDAPQGVVDRVTELERLRGPVSLSLLSKVFHRKRPRLVPILDKAIVDWYRPVTGKRGGAAWASIVGELRTDVAEPSNHSALEAVSNDVSAQLGDSGPSLIRIADIAIWMATR